MELVNQKLSELGVGGCGPGMEPSWIWVFTVAMLVIASLEARFDELWRKRKD